MHELISAAAAMILLSIFIFQAAADEKLLLETLALERILNEYAEEEFSEDEEEEKLEELTDRIGRIPNVDPEIRNGKLSITIHGIIGPSGIVRSEENRITIEKDFSLRIKEPENEEPDDSSGDNDPHGAGAQIQDDGDNQGTD